MQNLCVRIAASRPFLSTCAKSVLQEGLYSRILLERAPFLKTYVTGPLHQSPLAPLLQNHCPDCTTSCTRFFVSGCYKALGSLRLPCKLTSQTAKCDGFLAPAATNILQVQTRPYTDTRQSGPFGFKKSAPQTSREPVQAHGHLAEDLFARTCTNKNHVNKTASCTKVVQKKTRTTWGQYHRKQQHQCPLVFRERYPSHRTRF